MSWKNLAPIDWSCPHGPHQLSCDICQNKLSELNKEKQRQWEEWSANEKVRHQPGCSSASQQQNAVWTGTAPEIAFRNDVLDRLYRIEKKLDSTASAPTESACPDCLIEVRCPRHLNRPLASTIDATKRTDSHE